MPRLSVKGIRFNDTNEVTPHDPEVLIAHKPYLTDRSIYLCDFRDSSWQVSLV